MKGVIKLNNNNYEAMFIFKPTLNEDEVKNLLETVSETIKKNGGEVVDTQNFGRRKLAYSIKRHKEGAYYLVNFKGQPQSISRLEKTYRLNESILRTLIIKR